MTTNVSEGDELEPVTVTHDLRRSVAYAGASGDLNPLHYDPSFASTVPPAHEVIAHGMYGMGLASRALTRFAGGPEQVRGIKVRFSKPWVTGTAVTFAGRVTSVQDGEATVALTGTGEDGTVILKGTGTIAA